MIKITNEQLETLFAAIDYKDVLQSSAMLCTDFEYMGVIVEDKITMDVYGMILTEDENETINLEKVDVLFMVCDGGLVLDRVEYDEEKFNELHDELSRNIRGYLKG